MADDLLVRILGPLVIERRGEHVPLGSPKQRRLLTELASADGTTIPVERLIAALWDEDPPDSARANVQTYVARLRDALGVDGAIVTHPEGYALGPDVEVDARRFLEALDTARRTVDHEPERAATDLEEALALWRGDAYAEFEDRRARSEATRLHRLRAEARELLADAHRRCGDHLRALEVLEALLVEDPLRETAVLARARCLAATGRVPEALAGLRAYRRRLADELGLDPSSAFSDLERSLLRGATAAGGTEEPPARARAAGTVAVRPPRLGDATVGRAEELRTIEEALEASRLVSLVGPGGVGKTRLAAEVCDRAARAAWVDLAPVRRDDDVAPAVADALGMTLPGDADLSVAVPRALARFRGSVVIDNCEHVIDQIATLLDVTLAHHGDVRLLATTRERLDVAGELVVPIAPLPVPAPATATEQDPAVRLFLDRLTAAGGAPVGPSDAAAVAAAVDGLPLAIELAAARAVSLPITALLERLTQRLDILSGTRRRHGDRHRTLTDVIAWSHELLDPSDRLLFRRLSVFASTFTLDDVERICADHDLHASEIAPSLARLVEQSMVTVDGRGRYRVLEPLRLFAADLLAAAPEAGAVAERQRSALLELAARADREMTSPQEVTLVPEVEHALPDLRAVHARARADGDDVTVALLAGRLYRFAYAQARVDVLGWGRRLATTSASDDVTDVDRARALAAGAAGEWMAGRSTRAVELAERASSLTGGDDWAAITVTEALGDARHMTGDRDGAVAAFSANIAAAERLDHDGLVALGEASLAVTLAFHGEIDEALARARAAVTRAEDAAAPSAVALAHYALGEVLADREPEAALLALDRARTVAGSIHARFLEGLARTADVALRGRHGDPSEARERYREALELWYETGAHGPLVTALRNLVVLLVRVGEDAHAITLHTAVRRHANKVSFGSEADRLDAATVAARERLGSEGASAARRAGSQLSDLDDTVAHALALLGTDAELHDPPRRGPSIGR